MLLGDGSGASAPSAASAESAVIADFDGDGKLDVASSREFADLTTIYLNRLG